jgi:hypothetical protein
MSCDDVVSRIFQRLVDLLVMPEILALASLIRAYCRELDLARLDSG